MPGSPMTPVKIYCIVRLDIMHKSAQIACPRLYQQMIVVCHQRIAIDDYIMPFFPTRNYLNELFIVSFILKNLLSFVPTGRYVIYGAGKFYS
jgi:hypothetical protein